MKIAFLAAASSIHARRWVDALAERGHQLVFFSQHPDERAGALGAPVEWLPFRGTSGYFLNARRLSARLASLEPDLLCVHYASGYGTTAALTRFRPSLLSVWGSDVYDFPEQSRLKALLLRHNLRSATRLASTSNVMAQQVRRLAPDLGPIAITPFGVDCTRFSPRPDRDARFITVGSIRTFAAKYGLDLLLDAFAMLRDDRGIQDAQLWPRLRLVLIGGGEQRAALQTLAARLHLTEQVTFVEHVAHETVPDWLNRFDIFAMPSRLDSESFGVAAVEASACGLPVVVSDAGGLPEVVRDAVTGLVVPREDRAALAHAIRTLAMDEPLRRATGLAGREFVQSAYNWPDCVDRMESVCREAIAVGREPPAARSRR